jgi:hypothetical protein
MKKICITLTYISLMAISFNTFAQKVCKPNQICVIGYIANSSLDNKRIEFEGTLNLSVNNTPYSDRIHSYWLAWSDHYINLSTYTFEKPVDQFNVTINKINGQPIANCSINLSSPLQLGQQINIVINQDNFKEFTCKASLE